MSVKEATGQISNLQMSPQYFAIMTEKVNAVAFMKCPSPAAKVVILITFGAVTDEIVVKMTTYRFQCIMGRYDAVIASAWEQSRDLGIWPYIYSHWNNTSLPCGSIFINQGVIRMICWGSIGFMKINTQI